MPNSCSAIGCKNRDTKAIRKRAITFHRFPLDELRLKQWVKAVRRKRWQPSRDSRLCSDHFRPEDFFSKNERPRRSLKKLTIPSIFPAFPANNQMERKERKSPKKLVPEQEPIRREALSGDGSDGIGKRCILEHLEPRVIQAKKLLIKEANRTKREKMRLVQLDHNYAHPCSQEKMPARCERFRDKLIETKKKLARLHRKLYKVRMQMKKKVGNNNGAILHMQNRKTLLTPLQSNS